MPRAQVRWLLDVHAAPGARFITSYQERRCWRARRSCGADALRPRVHVSAAARCCCWARSPSLERAARSAHPSALLLFKRWGLVARQVPLASFLGEEDVAEYTAGSLELWEIGRAGGGDGADADGGAH